MDSLRAALRNGSRKFERMRGCRTHKHHEYPTHFHRIPGSALPADSCHNRSAARIGQAANAGPRAASRRPAIVARAVAIREQLRALLWAWEE
jgi:hypothetical protein